MSDLLLDRLRRICQHTSTVGYVGRVWYPEQIDLLPGQRACTEHTNGCQAVWTDDEYDRVLTETGMTWRHAYNATTGYGHVEPRELVP